MLLVVFVPSPAAAGELVRLHGSGPPLGAPDCASEFGERAGVRIGIL